MDVKVRSMTKKEITELRKAGLDPAVQDNADDRKMARVSVEMVDYILEKVYPGHDFDNEPYDECVALATKTYRKSMGDEEEVKNSRNTGPGGK